MTLPPSEMGRGVQAAQRKVSKHQAELLNSSFTLKRFIGSSSLTEQAPIVLETHR
jgi:hypothetical protein